MTQEQYKEFREDFQSIVWYKGQVTDKKKWIGTLGKWDKNGSHKIKIEDAIKELVKLRNILSDKLGKYGKTYDELRDVSKKVSQLTQRIRHTEANVDKYEKLGLKHKISAAKGSHATALSNFQLYEIPTTI